MSDLVINNHLINASVKSILQRIRVETNYKYFNKIEEKQDYVRTNCPNHKDGSESNPSFGIYCGNSNDIEFGTGHCFTCDYRCSLSELVAKCFNQTEDWANQWLIDNFSDTVVENVRLLTDFSLEKCVKEKHYLDESILNTFQDFHPYMNKRKLNLDVCQRFKVKYDDKSQSLVFPVWDENNKLLMLTRRSVLNKTFIIDKGVEKPIYLLNFIKQNHIQEVTLVESQINCLTLWGWNIPSVASFGCNITELQLDQLKRSGIKHLFVCYDGDFAGEKGTIKVISALKNYMLIDVIEMSPNKDVNDITESEFNSLNIKEGVEWLYEHSKRRK